MIFDGVFTRLVFGREKVLSGLGVLLQTYFSQVDYLVEPEKGLVIGSIGLIQMWLCADSKQT